MNRYTSVDEMICNCTSKKFQIHWVFNYQDDFKLHSYQQIARFYLDEYEGQENRLEIYQRNRERKIKYLCSLIGEPYDSLFPACDFITSLNEEHDTYFERRWLRRN